MSETIPIDVCVPTYGGETTIEYALDCMVTSIENSPFEMGRVIVDHKGDDDTPWVVGEYFAENGIDGTIHHGQRNLAESRNYLMEKAGAEWFVFLDDDVYVSPDYMRKLHGLIAPRVGAIQGRKTRWPDPNNKWIKRRTMRGTLFATLIRREAIVGLEIPRDCVVLEDEYIRKFILNQGYTWSFYQDAWLDHDTHERHKIDFREGYLAAKYGLLEYDYCLLHPFYAILSGQGLKNTMMHLDRATGYVYGWLKE